jgi:SAM-dependent methyltransferase
MHISAMHFGKLFFDTYLSNQGKVKILEVGSLDVNGSLRSVKPTYSEYTGVDFQKGDGVDIVLQTADRLPFEDNTFDAVVCSSVYEHAEFFWALHLECLRVLKSTGLLYVNAPSNGVIHRYPVDSWRFYPDAGASLTAWANKNGYKSLLLESFMGSSMGPSAVKEVWNDYIAVYLKDELHSQSHKERIVDSIDNVWFAYNSQRETSENRDGATPDLVLISKLRAETESLAIQVSQLSNALEAMSHSYSWRLTAPLRILARALRR